MALVTRCTQADCGTLFRVSVAQLQAHGGQVRCGRCGQVFDAFPTLSTVPDASLQTAAEPGASARPDGGRPGSPPEVSAALAREAAGRRAPAAAGPSPGDPAVTLPLGRAPAPPRDRPQAAPVPAPAAAQAPFPSIDPTVLEDPVATVPLGLAPMLEPARTPRVGATPAPGVPVRPASAGGVSAEPSLRPPAVGDRVEPFVGSRAPAAPAPQPPGPEDAVAGAAADRRVPGVPPPGVAAAAVLADAAADAAAVGSARTQDVRPGARDPGSASPASDAGVGEAAASGGAAPAFRADPALAADVQPASAPGPAAPPDAGPESIAGAADAAASTAQPARSAERRGSGTGWRFGLFALTAALLAAWVFVDHLPEPLAGLLPGQPPLAVTLALCAVLVGGLLQLVHRHEATWWIAVVVLSITLALQAAVAWRAEIAASHPMLRPVLDALCTAVGCQVGLPRESRDLSIESSDLLALDAARPQLIQLVATIRNRGERRVALPAIELTLADGQERPLARRVLLPAQYAAQGIDPDAGVRPGEEFSIRLTLDTTDLRPVGYRLYLFHP